MNLRATLDDLDVLVDASKPATKNLAPFFARAAPAGARRAADDPRPEPADPAQGRQQRPDRPAAQGAEARRARPSPSFAHSITALHKTEPVVKFIRPYTPDFVGWLRDFGQGAANYDANGHYARIQPIFNAFSFADNPAAATLTPIPNAQRLAGPADRQRQALPGRRQPAARRTARRRGVTPTAPSTAIPPQVPPGP